MPSFKSIFIFNDTLFSSSKTSIALTESSFDSISVFGFILLSFWIYGPNLLAIDFNNTQANPKDINQAVKQGFSSPDQSWFKGESIDFVKENNANNWFHKAANYRGGASFNKFIEFSV